MGGTSLYRNLVYNILSSLTPPTLPNLQLHHHLYQSSYTTKLTGAREYIFGGTPLEASVLPLPLRLAGVL